MLFSFGEPPFDLAGHIVPNKGKQNINKSINLRAKIDSYAKMNDHIRSKNQQIVDMIKEKDKNSQVLFKEIEILQKRRSLLREKKKINKILGKTYNHIIDVSKIKHLRTKSSQNSSLLQFYKEINLQQIEMSQMQTKQDSEEQNYEEQYEQSDKSKFIDFDCFSVKSFFS